MPNTPSHRDMSVTISVHPLGAGWSVCWEHESIVFLSGARAEAAAQSLARAEARCGRPATVIIHSRDGAVAGSWCFTPTPSGAARQSPEASATRTLPQAPP